MEPGSGGGGLGARLPEAVTLHQLRLLAAVVEHRGVSRAAAALGMSQPAVSHQLRALSDSLGVAVIEVVGRSVRLTQAGELLHEHGARVLAELEAAGVALDELRGLRRGRIRVAGDTTVSIYVLPDLLGAFHQAYPEVEVSMLAGNRQGLLDRLVDHEVDFVVSGRLWPDPPIALEVVPLLANELVAIASPRNPLVGRGRLSLAELATQPFISRERGSGTRETAEEAMRAAGVTCRPAMELASNGAIKRAVARDLGVSILSRYAAALELELGNVVELPVAGFPLRRQWHLVHARDRRLGPVEQAFLAFVEAGRWKAGLGGSPTTD